MVNGQQLLLLFQAALRSPARAQLIIEVWREYMNLFHELSLHLNQQYNDSAQQKSDVLDQAHRLAGLLSLLYWTN